MIQNEIIFSGDQLKVMALDPAGNLWGSERVLIDFLQEIPRHQVNMALCCPKGTALQKCISGSQIQVYPYFTAELHKLGRHNRLIAAAGLLKACLDHKSQAIYVNQAGATKIALLVGLLLKIPVLPHVRLLEDVKYLEALNPSASRVPYIFAVSHSISNSFKSKHLKSRVQTFYDAYTPSVSTPYPTPMRELKPRFCCAARLVPGKRQDLIIRAAGILVRNGVNLHVDLYGAGIAGESFEYDLRTLLNDEGVNGYVKLVGFDKDVEAKLSSYNSLVAPSDNEPLGRSILEAWNAGILPIVYSGSGGSAEIVTRSGGGITYDEQTPEALAAAMMVSVQLGNNEYAKMVDRGREWTRQNCSAETYTNSLLSVFEEAVLT